MESEEGYKGFWDLLDDARGVLVQITFAVLIFSVISYLLSERILIILLKFLQIQPVSYAPQEAILSVLKLSLYSGINSFTELTVVQASSGAILRCPATRGKQKLI